MSPYNQAHFYLGGPSDDDESGTCENVWPSGHDGNGVCQMSGFIVGQEIDIVVPQHLADMPGDIASPVFTVGFRGQELFLADEFATIPETHKRLIAGAFRGHSQESGPVYVVLDLQIALSTTDQRALTLDFEFNHGADKAVVFEVRLRGSFDQESLVCHTFLTRHFSSTRRSDET